MILKKHYTKNENYMDVHKCNNNMQIKLHLKEHIVLPEE